MRKGIVIGASEATRPFYEDLMKSLKTDYPIYICWEGLGRADGSFEIGAIAAGADLFDEFIYLHDTVLIKDNSIFDKLFAIDGHVALSPNFFHYMGKYLSADLPNFPTVKDKEQAIHHEGRWFTKPYSTFEQPIPVVSDKFEEKHGRRNMVVENDYIIKFKATFR